MTDSPSRPSEEAVEAAILAVAGQPGAAKSVTPEDVARSVATGPDWQSLLPSVRRGALRLAQTGRLVIYRKGKPVDPAELRGVYRLGLPPAS
ncbi:uncharacterized protein DUF3253 [Ancylobacter aquaticus]|uniref:Uncharacterized protein DUF3253 n=1 Tax=Ancylobacter aquaticus TaxID=100 RepID=A0A4R1I1X2_ANCAQ|nr:DUF3253 domain-containing protein [Ancylobacter aquaticus]TCK27923.1 uncharacterized protein DUF3253 [Ancylobacter aquaticus]